VHGNPALHELAHRVLGTVENVHLVAPMPYRSFVHLLTRATAVVTDSGGIQEEAPSLGVPVVVARARTERPEGFVGSRSVVAGTHPLAVRRQLEALLEAPRPAPRLDELPLPNPYGDGRATERIVDTLAGRAGADASPWPAIAS
jgi:UDP-N-acetylglucosamine 2-epimerase (non-hydrolysing)